MRAVQAEHSKNIQNPSWRIHGTIDYVFDQNGLGRFSTGDLSTLNKPDMTQQLKQFAERWYYPNNTCLVTMAPDSLDQQMANVKTVFGEARNPPQAYHDPRKVLVDPKYVGVVRQTGRYETVIEPNDFQTLSSKCSHKHTTPLP